MRRVLLVDDSALVRNSMQAALEPYGLELEHAENGSVAVAKAMASCWDLIFLDVVMPHMDGPTALREIRSRGNQTPVVLVTSVSTATVVAGAVKLGRVYYIAKPFTPTHIRAIATRLLKLDPAMLTKPPRVLLQHTDPALPDTLRKLLPNHVVLDTSQSLAQSLELAATGKRELVILESSDSPAAVGVAADALRAVLPAAGIFAMTNDTASPRWQPQRGLDGLLPRVLDTAAVAGFLVPNFLRPLALLDGNVARVAGFRGPPAHLPAYLTMISRSVLEQCHALDRATALEIDLRHFPLDPDALVAGVAALDEALRAVTAARSFRLTPEMRQATRGRLDRFTLLEP